MADSTTLMDIISKFCCCKNGTAQVDRERLLNNGHNAEEYTIPNGTGNATYASSSRGATLSDRNLPSQAKSREEEEEDLMNKILDRTQQSIIDVTNLENNSLDIDMIQRSRLYVEAIKRHDALSDRRKGVLLASCDAATTLDSTSSAHPTQHQTLLLANLGPRAPEMLTKNVVLYSRDELDLLNRASELFLDAHHLGAQIECKEELIVYMSLDD